MPPIPDVTYQPFRHSSKDSFASLNYRNVDLSDIKFKTFNTVGLRNKKFILNPNFENLKDGVSGKFDFLTTGFTSNAFGISFDTVDQATTENTQKTNPTHIANAIDQGFFPKSVFKSFIDVIDLTTFGDGYNAVADSFHNSFMRFSDDGKSTDVVNFEKYENMVTRENVSTLMSPYYFSNEMMQSFFFFDFSSGDFKLESGDSVKNATINLKILSHFGERTISSGVMQGASSLFGPLRINPRVFQVIRITKEYDRTLCDGEVENPEARFGNALEANFFESYYGTSESDVDENVVSEFTISEPMKRGQILKIDITDHLQDAIDNRSSKLRFAIRPKMTSYGRNGSLSGNQSNKDPDAGGFGVGNHYFQFERGVGEDDQPRVSVDLVLKKGSSGVRRARFQRVRKVQL